MWRSSGSRRQEDTCLCQEESKRGLAVNCATGWDMRVEEQMKEVEQRVRDEEPVLLIGSPVCRAFSTLNDLS